MAGIIAMAGVMGALNLMTPATSVNSFSNSLVSLVSVNGTAAIDI